MHVGYPHCRPRNPPRSERNAAADRSRDETPCAPTCPAAISLRSRWPVTVSLLVAVGVEEGSDEGGDESQDVVGVGVLEDGHPQDVALTDDAHQHRAGQGGA
jgi:hypothetical protein